MIRFRRGVFLLAVAALLGGLLAPAAGASVAQPANFTPPTIKRVSWSALRYEIRMHRVVVGPSRDTGYGEMVITGLTRLSNGRYRATYRLYDMRRLVLSTYRSYSGFCWPWNMGPLGLGCAGWNNPNSWNWPDIFNKAAALASKYGMVSPLTYQRQQKCIQGAVKAGSFGVVGKGAVAALLGRKDLVVPTPGGWALGMVGGCVVSLLW